MFNNKNNNNQRLSMNFIWMENKVPAVESYKIASAVQLNYLNDSACKSVKST